MNEVEKCHDKLSDACASMNLAVMEYTNSTAKLRGVRFENFILSVITYILAVMSLQRAKAANGDIIGGRKDG